MDLPAGFVTEFEWGDRCELTGDLGIAADSLGESGSTVSDPAVLTATCTASPSTGQPWTAAEVNALEAGSQLYRLNPLVGSETRVTRLYATVVHTLDTYAYNNGLTGMDDLTSIAGPGAASFTYTPDGDLENKTQAGNTWTHSYNEAGRLREVKTSGVVRATYAHDGLGRRVKTTEDSVTTYFVYSLGLDPLVDEDRDVGDPPRLRERHADRPHGRRRVDMLLPPRRPRLHVAHDDASKDAAFTRGSA